MQRIVVQSVSKKFHIGETMSKSPLRFLLSLVIPQERKRLLWAVSDASFSVGAGEIVGVVGPNASPKILNTTFQNLANPGIALAGSSTPSINGCTFNNAAFPFTTSLVTYPAETTGNIIPFIDLRSGEGRLTLEDNIRFLGAFFGMSWKTINQRLESIISFAELEKLRHAKLYQFSAGMYYRLTFSIALHADPDILLLDEVFEVGDEGFKKKAAEQLQQLAQKGGSIMFVSHDLETVSRYCQRVIWLDAGKIKMVGQTADVIARYKATYET